jgi:hypothetical protein
MSHCHDEHCEHDHDDLPESGEQFLLYSKIDIDNVRCLNESEPDSGKSVIRPWNERQQDSKVKNSFKKKVKTVLKKVDFDVFIYLVC